MKFQCIHTKQIYEFLSEQDITEMLKHGEYVVVEETEPVKLLKQKKETK